MQTNPLRRLKALGQSIWLDDIRRGWIDDGSFARLIEADGVSGVTSNPAIFRKAIAEHRDYDTAIAALARRGTDAVEIAEVLTVEDVCRAADLFRGVYDASGGRDGYVSLEVSPHLAHDTEATVAEATRLWGRVNRANAMIKVPATRAGLPAIRRLIAAGVNVNVTLLFGVTRYREVVEAWLAGLDDCAATGRPMERIASVVSFFLSRIDTLADKRLGALGTPQAKCLRGAAAIASARLAYQHYKEWTASPRWLALAQRGAQPQRLLWASTSAKDPAYSDIKYVEALIGRDTVNTLPPDTLAAYRERGRPAARLEHDLDAARALPQQLAALGIDLEAVADELEREGVRKFVEPYDALIQTLEEHRTERAVSP